MRVHPRHRGDCAHFFVAPQQTERIHFDGPVAVINPSNTKQPVPGAHLERPIHLCHGNLSRHAPTRLRGCTQRGGLAHDGE